MKVESRERLQEVQSSIRSILCTSNNLPPFHKAVLESCVCSIEDVQGVEGVKRYKRTSEDKIASALVKELRERSS